MPHAARMWLAVLLRIVPAVAYFEANPKMIEGVPIYNYNMAKLARVGHSPRDGVAFMEMMEDSKGHAPDDADDADDIEWIIVMDDSTDDKHVDDLCHDSAAHGCLGEGHPSEHGVPVAGVKATVAGLRKLLKNHSKEVRHVEPNLPIYLPPKEVVIEEKKRPAKKSEQSVMQAEPEALLQAGKYFAMLHITEGFVKAWGFPTKQNALDKFAALKKSGQTAIAVDGDFTTLDYYNQDPEQEETVMSDFKKWCQDHAGCEVKNARPTPRPSPAPGRSRRSRPRPKPRPPPSNTDPMPDGNTRRRREKKTRRRLQPRSPLGRGSH